MQNHNPNLSMHEKSYYKRRINREHSSNFRAGYVHINEEHLHKTGLRGRKKYFLVVMIVFLVLLTLVNLGGTAVLLYVLRVNTHGIRSIKFGSMGQVQFSETANLKDVFLVQNQMQDVDQGLEIQAVDSTVVLSSNEGSTALAVGSDGVEISGVENFQVIDPVSGKKVLDTDSISLPKTMNSLSAQDIQMSGIKSPWGQDLTLFVDDGDMTITGSEDVTADGKRVEVSAENSIHIDVENLSLSSPAGVYLGGIDHMMKVSADPDFSAESFQLCVCVPSGQLFKVPVGLRCDAASETGESHPCDM